MSDRRATKKTKLANAAEQSRMTRRWRTVIIYAKRDVLIGAEKKLTRERREYFNQATSSAVRRHAIKVESSDTASIVKVVVVNQVNCRVTS